jgi:dolichyl-diphosphooligosaccharide--protein glycosyltransferase
VKSTVNRLIQWAGGRWFALLLMALLLWGLYVRIYPAMSLVFPSEGDIRLFDTDSYYHLRHARFSVDNFPHVQRWDIGSHYPDGIRARSAGLFDVFLALVALTVGLGHPSDYQLLLVCAWVPPILGLFALIALFSVVRKLLNPRAGLLALLTLTLYPGRFLNRSLLGYTDHHVAEVLLGLLTLLGLLSCLKDQTHRENSRKWYFPAIVAALPFALLFFTWGGSPIYIVLLGLAGLLVGTADIAIGAPQSKEIATTYCRYGLGILVIILPVAYIWPNSLIRTHVELELFLLSSGLSIGLPGYLWLGRKGIKAGHNPRLLGSLMAFSVLLGSWLFLRFILQAEDLIDLLLEPKSAKVVEHSDVTPSLFINQLGLSGALAAVAVVLTLFKMSIGRFKPGDAISILFGGCMIGLWVSTHDYNYAAAPFAAVLSGILLGSLLNSIQSLFKEENRSGDMSTDENRDPDCNNKTKRSKLGIILVPTATVLLVTGLAIPAFTIQNLDPPIPTRAHLSRLMIIHDGWIQSLNWLRQNTSRPVPTLNTMVEDWNEGGGYHYPDGSYGIVSAWDFGSFISALGRRTPIVSQAPKREPARWFLESTEEGSLRLLDSMCFNQDPRCGNGQVDDNESCESFRYVVMDSFTIGTSFLTKALEAEMVGWAPSHFSQQIGITEINGISYPIITFKGHRYAELISAQLYLRDGNGLEHYRMVYQSPHRSYLRYISERISLEDPNRISTRLETTPVNSEEHLELFEIEASYYVSLIGEDGLVYSYGGVILPSVKIFEIVEGAEVVGETTPFSTIELEIMLRSRSDDGEINYTQRGNADRNGQFSLTIPYATTNMNTGVVSRGPARIYLISGENERRTLLTEITISEEDVQSGSRIEVLSQEETEDSN